MRKILIILFSLFCLNLGAFAVGVDCWEEYSILEAEPTTSALRTAITNAGGTAIKVSTRALVFFHYYNADSANTAVIQLYAFNDGDTWNNYRISNSLYGLYTNRGNSKNEMVSFRNGSYERNYMTHFVHTYCIVNTSSSGGSGGGATGSVNFIIKATS